MKKFLLVLISLATLTLAACGGGGSSSDTSSAGNQFFGAQTVAFLGTSFDSEFVMTVSDTTVTINDADFTASGPLNGSNFTVDVPAFTDTSDGITCTLDITYTGTLETADRATGTISGSAVCDGFPFQITGTFAANRG